MYIGEQLINPPAERLRLSAQLGVERVVIDNRSTDLVKAGGVQYSGFKLASYSPEAARKHSYWGVGYPTNQDEGDAESSMLCARKWPGKSRR